MMEKKLKMQQRNTLEIMEEKINTSGARGQAMTLSDIVKKNNSTELAQITSVSWPNSHSV